ncbi:hypothetical protein M5689_005522 [Euphorbia peplus]|nr:hypothetical protein M5689_005522 [Euphorbia peplus]
MSSKTPPIAAVSAAAATPKLNPLLTATSLVLILTLPITLTITTISKFSSTKSYESYPKPFPFPSLSTIHFAEICSAVLMSVAAARVCVNGGFNCFDSEALFFYLIQIGLSVAWNPVLLRVCDADIALIFCSANFLAVLICYFLFGEVDRISRVFVIPCLVWAGFLLFITFLMAPRILLFVEDDLNEVVL